MNNLSNDQAGIRSHERSQSPEILMKDEMNLILEEAQNRCPRDHLLILLTVLTGLRNSEAIGLNICTVAPFGPVSNILDLPSTIAKGRKPRQIPLREDLVLVMNDFINKKALRGEFTLPESALFVAHKTKKRLSPRDFQRIVLSISIKAINRSIHPHVLRHTFATNLLNASNIRVVQSALGHSNIHSTAIYTHPSVSDLKTAIELI